MQKENTSQRFIGLMETDTLRKEIVADKNFPRLCFYQAAEETKLDP